jgi:hypothetical protein
MPTIENFWLALVSLVTFFVASSFLLRVGCELANWIGQLVPRYTTICLPSYRSCVAITLGAVVVLSLASVAETPVVTHLMQWHANQWMWQTLIATAGWLAFAALVAVGLSETQPVPTRLIVLGSLLHVCLMLAFLIALPRVVAAAFYL